MKSASVLVLSSDDLAAALLAALVEAFGRDVTLPRAGEAPRAALRRLRPSLALVHCDHELACNESFLGPAKMTDTAVVIVGAPRHAEQLEVFAAKHQVATAVISADTRPLRAALEVAHRDRAPSAR